MSRLPRPPVDAAVWRALPASDKIALVQSVWMDAGSAAKIAAAIGPSISRNAVIGIYERNKELGKTHPLGVPAGSLKNRKYVKKEKAVKLPRRDRKNGEVVVRTAPTKPREIPRQPEFRCLPLEALAKHECKWPSGDPKEEGFGFCGAHAPDGPYCAYHMAIAYHPPRERK